MKLFIPTLLLILASSVAYGQNPRTNDRPANLPDPGTIVLPRTDSRTDNNANTAREQRPDTDLEYKKLVLNGDYFFAEKQFTDALSLYEQAMAYKPDQIYPKDQIVRCQAELQAQKKWEESYEDRTLREQAQHAHAPVVSKYQADSLAVVEAFNRAHTVHFTGLVVSDYFSAERGISKAFEDDGYSDFLVPGRYTDLKKVMKDAAHFTFDGIVVPKGTRLIIYRGANFDGEIALDVTGPAIVNNYLWKFHDWYIPAHTKTFEDEALQAEYPQATRQWSERNMHEWVYGSLEIIAVPQ